jgi:hypothetical protein
LHFSKFENTITDAIHAVTVLVEGKKTSKKSPKQNETILEDLKDTYVSSDLEIIATIFGENESSHVSINSQRGL